MDVLATSARWFLPVVVPVCLYVCWTDMARMKITNAAVVALFAIFALVGLAVLPWDVYVWRYTHLLIVLAAGIALTAAGAMGAGDAKFLAAAAPFVHPGDLRFVLALFASTLLAAVLGHRVARATPLRRLAPDWASWSSGARFPMGLALGGTLMLYLGAGAIHGR